MRNTTPKPLLVLPPAPGRWQQLEDLYADLAPVWKNDLRLRVTEPLDEARDAVAVVPDGGRLLAGVCIRRRGELGVLGHVLTRPEVRGRGLARTLLQTLLSWFDMTGGKWLYVNAPPDLAHGLFEKFGFHGVRPLGDPSGVETRSLVRSPGTAPSIPYDPPPSGGIEVQPLNRAAFPAIVALLKHYRGPDPRVDATTSSAGAETTAIELLDREQQGTCLLRGAIRDHRLIAIGTVATDTLGKRTYGMIAPAGADAEPLRRELQRIAANRGYEQLDFPLETLGAPTGEQPGPRDRGGPGEQGRAAPGYPPDSSTSSTS